MELTSEIKAEYPFESNFLDLNGQNLHYIDEGEGDLIFCVHGNPTWSFYYRDVIKQLSKTNRVIAFDHIGCGLSDKPQHYHYTLEQRIQDFTMLVKFIGIQRYSLIVHDWGGAIGFGHATRFPESIQSIVILNTAAFLSKSIPFTIALCKNKYFGEFLVRNLNGFCYPATFMTTTKKLSKNIKDAYLLPYPSREKRIAISEFVKDIPLNKDHKSYSTLATIEEKLPTLNCPKLILWGGNDFCFHDEFFARFRNIYPEADYRYYKDAGHYILEDAKVETTAEMIKFFERI